MAGDLITARTLAQDLRGLRVAVGMLLIAGACSSEPDSLPDPEPAAEASAEPMACRDLRPETRATLMRGFPGGWTLPQARIVTADDLQRGSDGAPSEVVAGWIRDASGDLYAPEPVLWVIEGGTEPEFQTSPKSFYVLNEVSREFMAVVLETGVEQGRQFRPWPDATAPSVGWSLEHPALALVVDCLGAPH